MTRKSVKSLKSDGRYKDAPRFPAIYGFEDAFKKGGSLILRTAIKDVTNKLKRLNG